MSSFSSNYCILLYVGEWVTKFLLIKRMSFLKTFLLLQALTRELCNICLGKVTNVLSQMNTRCIALFQRISYILLSRKVCFIHLHLSIVSTINKNIIF